MSTAVKSRTGGGVDFKECLAALTDLVNTVEATGGLVEQYDGMHVPECDHEWIDLGEATLRAHRVLRDAGVDIPLRIRKDDSDAE